MIRKRKKTNKTGRRALGAKQQKQQVEDWVIVYRTGSDSVEKTMRLQSHVIF
jgi:hypothetical protein